MSISISYLKASDLMRDPIIVKPDISVSDALATILNEGIGALLVVNEKNELVGIVTKRDILWALKYRASDAKYLKVKDIMKKNPITVTSDTSIVDIVNIMLQHNISHIPVVEDGKLIGIISDRELLEVLSELFDKLLQRGEATE
ncbi:MAG: CBS domain-containing protein [Thermoprotei archaeon]